jgi:hypothetical protein
MRFAELAALARGEDKDRVKTEFDALKKAFAEGGKRAYWEAALEFEASKKDLNHLMRLAAIHARLNQPTEAFKYLRQARQETPRDFEIGIQTNPSYDSLRTDKRFQELIDELWRRK